MSDGTKSSSPIPRLISSMSPPAISNDSDSAKLALIVMGHGEHHYFPTGTSKSITITSRSGHIDDSSERQLFRETGGTSECRHCGREASEGLQFCLGFGANLDRPQPRQPPAFNNDWAQPAPPEEKKEWPWCHCWHSAVIVLK